MENFTITKKVGNKKDVADLLNQIFSIIEERDWMVTISINKPWNVGATAIYAEKKED